MSTQKEHAMLSTIETAEILGVTPHTLLNWRKDGYGPQPVRRIGHNFVYDREEVEQFAALRAKVARRPS